MNGEHDHTTWTAPGGTLGHMHEVLDGLSPAEAAAAVEHEFPGCHAHLSDLGAVWAEIPDTGFTIHEPNAERMWQVLAAELFRRLARAHAVGAA